MSSTWSVEFEKEAIRDLERLDSLVREDVLEKIEWLKNHFEVMTPHPLGAVWHGFYKIRIGDYRAIYDITWSKQLLTIVIIDHRSRVYKRKKRS